MNKLNFDNSIDNNDIAIEHDNEQVNKIDDNVKEELNYLSSYQAYIRQYSSINEF